MIRIGDEVICIKERNLPQYVGKVWRVVGIIGALYLCENKAFYDDLDGYPFKDDEIVPTSSLLKELI